jgi:hypothetical protein
MAFPDHILRVNVFGSGKVNILGAKEFEQGAIVHKFLGDVFDANWEYLVRLKPRKDSEKKAAPRAAPVARRIIELPRPAPPVYTLSDAEFDALLDEIYPGGGSVAVAAPPSRERKSGHDKNLVDKILAIAEELENDLETPFEDHVTKLVATCAAHKHKDSDSLVLDEVGEEDETNNQEDPLEHDAP